MQDHPKLEEIEINLSENIHLEETEEEVIEIDPAKVGNISISCSKNNIKLTLTDPYDGDKVLFSMTPTRLKFYKSARKTPINVYETILEFLKILNNEFHLEYIFLLKIKGFSRQRYQIFKALRHPTNTLNFTKILNITGFPFNGCRPKKARRLKRLPT